jgi:hypothetical protein
LAHSATCTKQSDPIGTPDEGIVGIEVVSVLVEDPVLLAVSHEWGYRRSSCATDQKRLPTSVELGLTNRICAADTNKI